MHEVFGMEYDCNRINCKKLKYVLISRLISVINMPICNVLLNIFVSVYIVYILLEFWESVILSISLHW